LAGGNVALNIVPPDTEEQFQLSIPSFTDLMNYAKTYVWPIAKTMVGTLGGPVLNRLANYLMNDATFSNTTPGFICAASNV